MKSVNHQELVEELSKDLQKKINPPEWAQFVKTGHGKQRPPIREDWWHVRSAAVLLKVQKLGPIGVSKISVQYGAKKNRGVRPEKFTRGSRNIIRKVLQDLENGKLIQKDERGVHKGRMLTKEGLKLINEASKRVAKKK